MSGTEGSTETIGQRLRRLRLERGFSQRELAAPGVSYAYISRIEAGSRQPSVKALRRLAAKLGVSTEYLETGIDIRDSEARELRLSDAELALRLDDPKEAEDRIAAILVDALHAGDVPNATRARIALAFVAFERSDYGSSVRLFEQVLADDRPAPAERLDVYTTLARAYAFVGTADRAVELLTSCLDEVRQADRYDVAVEIRYATALSYALSDAGLLSEAAEVLRTALESASEVDQDPYMRVRLYWSFARLSEMEGKFPAALHHIRRAIALLEATEDTIHLGRAHVTCSVIMAAQGNPDAAETQLDLADELLSKHGTRDDIAWVKTERSHVAALRGNAKDAIALAREAVELRSGRNEPELGSSFAALADGLALAREDGEAHEAYARAVELLSSQRRWREAAQAAQSWGRMLRRAGREAEALDVLERAAELGMRLAPAQSLER